MGWTFLNPIERELLRKKPMPKTDDLFPLPKTADELTNDLLKTIEGYPMDLVAATLTATLIIISDIAKVPRSTFMTSISMSWDQFSAQSPTQAPRRGKQ